jgi:hypothetical protein
MPCGFSRVVWRLLSAPALEVKVRALERGRCYAENDAASVASVTPDRLLLIGGAKEEAVAGEHVEGSAGHEKYFGLVDHRERLVHDRPWNILAEEDHVRLEDSVAVFTLRNDERLDEVSG